MSVGFLSNDGELPLLGGHNPLRGAALILRRLLLILPIQVRYWGHTDKGQAAVYSRGIPCLTWRSGESPASSFRSCITYFQGYRATIVDQRMSRLSSLPLRGKPVLKVLPDFSALHYMRRKRPSANRNKSSPSPGHAGSLLHTPSLPNVGIPDPPCLSEQSQLDTVHPQFDHHW